ncbi:hypothetical protein [Devosia lucknowensis]|nr:hypothetical protein [Devosia lucknowensis]
MSTVSTRRDDIVEILMNEARDLVELGLKHPGQAKRIGSIIVYYKRLIEQVKGEAASAA